VTAEDTLVMTEERKPAFALDVMGTDAGPATIIRGAIDAAGECRDICKIVLVGRSDLIKSELARYRDLPPNIDIHHAQEEVTMHDSPADAVRRRDTSIAEAIHLHKDGVKRPAIASFFPTVERRPTIVLDVGANSDCKPLNLYQFGVMGSIVANHVFRVDRPRIGLLSIGEERSKGNDLILEAYALLEANKSLNFIGNIEGRDILMGKVEVVVTDGFVGNVVLKFAESVEGFLTSSIRRQVSTNIFSRFGALLMSPFLRRLRNTFDYAEVGGAPLLGINGVCIICHGESSAKAIRQAIMVAREIVGDQINKKIETELLAGRNGDITVAGAVNGIRKLR
jgi:glycerol-3-phosphate acyltransferase PlsX